MKFVEGKTDSVQEENCWKMKWGFIRGDEGIHRECKKKKSQDTVKSFMGYFINLLYSHVFI